MDLERRKRQPAQIKYQVEDVGLIVRTLRSEGSGKRHGRETKVAESAVPEIMGILSCRPGIITEVGTPRSTVNAAGPLHSMKTNRIWELSGPAMF